MKIAGRNLLDYVAFAISSFFSPYVTAAIFIILIVYTYAHDLNQFFPWMLTFFIFAIVVPGFYILWLLEAKKISDIHMADASTRKTPLIVAAVSSVIGTVILYYLHAARPVFVISVIYAVNSVVLAAITQKWKISMHTGMFASIATITVVIFGLNFWWLYLTLLPLAWSRIYRKRHTILQTIFGALVTAILTLIIFHIFHYI
jgi:membrane-associated phospholipid phosphatase